MDIDLPTTKEKEMRDSTEIFDKHGKKFIAFLEEDSDRNSEVWSIFSGSRSSLPKKGHLVVYLPQGHLEYEARLPEYESPPHDELDLTGDLLPVPGSPGQPPKEEVHTYDLEPQIICRVEHVQLMIKEADDDICANITLHPEPQVNSEEKELELSDEDEDCICDEDKSPAKISTPSLFSKILKISDFMILSIPPKSAIELFCLDNESMDLQNEVTAKDFHGNEWKFPLVIDKKNGNWVLGWSEFVRARHLLKGDTVIFLREKDTKLPRFGIRRKESKDTKLRHNEPLTKEKIDDPLSLAAGAILKNIFSVMYESRYHP